MTDIPRNIQERIATRLVGRERQVLEMRLGIGMARGQTLAEIGEVLSISRERVRQLQASALSKVELPELNAILLVGDIKNPNSVSANKWKKRVRERVKRKYGSLDQPEQDAVKVWIGSTHSEPINLFASWARVDGSRTLFLNDEGEIVGDWATEQVHSIQWPSEAKVKPSARTHQERMDRIRAAYPRAWLAWDSNEDTELRDQFAKSMNFDSICHAHARAPGGINARLKKLQLIPQEQTISETRKMLGAD